VTAAVATSPLSLLKHHGACLITLSRTLLKAPTDDRREEGRRTAAQTFLHRSRYNLHLWYKRNDSAGHALCTCVPLGEEEEGEKTSWLKGILVDDRHWALAHASCLRLRALPFHTPHRAYYLCRCPVLLLYLSSRAAP